MSRPLLLDLFCGGGGAAMGYYRAGIDVLGVDIRPQPNYPFRFLREDALETLHLILLGQSTLGYRPEDFAVVHASPPCQAHVKGLVAVNRSQGRSSYHLDLIGQTRDLLVASGRPYVIENVEGAPLRSSVRLCGSMFSLMVRRHRLFESSMLLLAPCCRHDRQREAKYWTSWRPGGEHRLASVVQVYGNSGCGIGLWEETMGINWMTRDELSQAIPPAYTFFLGKQILAYLENR